MPSSNNEGKNHTFEPRRKSDEDSQLTDKIELRDVKGTMIENCETTHCAPFEQDAKEIRSHIDPIIRIKKRKSYLNNTM